MQTGLSIGGVHHAEEEQETAGAAKRLLGPAFLPVPVLTVMALAYSAFARHY